MAESCLDAKECQPNLIMLYDIVGAGFPVYFIRLQISSVLLRSSSEPAVNLARFFFLLPFPPVSLYLRCQLRTYDFCLRGGRE